MKAIKYFTITASIAAMAMLFACGGAKQEPNTNNTTGSENLSSATPDLTAGKAIYEGKGNCHTCHMKDGVGMPNTFPPLASSDYLVADKKRAIKVTLNGSPDPITVNGKSYPGKLMTSPQGLSDQEVADVVNYVLNSWGNKGGSVTAQDVTDVKAGK